MTLSREQIPIILAMWGLKTSTIGDPISGYRNEVWPIECPDKSNIALILYKKEDGILQQIKRTNVLGLELSKRGLLVRSPYDPRIVQLNTNFGPRYLSVYYYLDGETIPWEAYTMDHLKLLGWAMSDFHHHARSINLSLLVACDEYRIILTRMFKYLSQDNVVKAMQNKLGISVTAMPALFFGLLDICDQLTAQPLHMDFVRGNVLFQDNHNRQMYCHNKVALSGILDLEKAASGPPIMDVARTMAFLLVDCKYKTEDKIKKYFLISGYNRRGRSKLENLELLEPLIDMFLMYDFYKFLRHNPYENLDQNEHFMRTKLLLIKRHLLTAEDGRISERPND